MKMIVENQRARFQSGNTRPLEARFDALERLRKAIEARQEAILNALHEDLGKGPAEAYASEVAYILGEIRFAMRHLDGWVHARRRRSPLSLWPAKSLVVAEPLGVCLILGPWNYPFQLLFSPLVSALAAGNCAVIKPSEHAPQTADVVRQLIRDAFDEDQVAVVTGGVQVAEQLLEQRFDKIFFTGSTAVGRKVMAAAARHLTPVTLELGGKCPCIVTADTDLEVAARRIAWGKFLNAGQTCVAPDHIWIKRGRTDAFIEILRATIAQFYNGDPLHSEDYASIVNHRHFDRLMGLLEGAKIEIGGRHDREKRHIEPTVVRGIDTSHPLMREEIFGPILPILEYDSITEVIDHQRSQPSPLALYIFTEDEALTKRMIAEIRSGGVCVNDVISHLLNRHLPFGGLGESGMGRCHGKAGFEAFSHVRSIMRRRLKPDPSHRYPPIKLGLGKLKRILKFFGEG